MYIANINSTADFQLKASTIKVENGKMSRLTDDIADVWIGVWGDGVAIVFR